MERLHAVVLTHDDEWLGSIPKHPSLEAVDLRDLGLPAALAGNDMAESRYLVSDAALTLSDEAEYVGILPARWDERFPLWPPLEHIDAVEPLLAYDALLAPSASPLPTSLVDDWIALQEQVHPGIAEVLRAVPRDDPPPGIGNPVWGNTFIVHRSVYLDFITFFRRAFDAIHARWGFDLPYSYRCPDCGFVSERRVGRWKADRHASYLYERVTGLYFAGRPDLRLVDPTGRERPAKPQERAFALLPPGARSRVVPLLASRSSAKAACAGSNGDLCR